MNNLKFDKMYEMILEDIVQSVTPEEKIERQKKYQDIMLKQIFDQLIEEGKMVKNADGSYDIDGNLDLSSLVLTNLKDIQYRINKVNGWFNCSYNKLTNLVGCPKIILREFLCNDNLLTSLRGCPNKINYYFSCFDNLLTSVEGMPKSIDGNLIIYRNKHKFTKKEIRKVCKVKGYIYV
jgi:hypothetical protein